MIDAQVKKWTFDIQRMDAELQNLARVVATNTQAGVAYRMTCLAEGVYSYIEIYPTKYSYSNLLWESDSFRLNPGKDWTEQKYEQVMNAMKVAKYRLLDALDGKLQHAV